MVIIALAGVVSLAMRAAGLGQPKTVHAQPARAVREAVGVDA